LKKTIRPTYEKVQVLLSHQNVFSLMIFKVTPQKIMQQ